MSRDTLLFIIDDMKNIFDYQNIIDLEYFFHKDETIDSSTLHERDRNIFLAQKEQQSTGASDEANLLLGWLKQRQTKEFAAPDTRSPGQIFQDTKKLATTAALIKGILGGFLAGWLFFTYTGTTPVNVFYYLLVFVAAQLISILFFFAGFVIKNLAGIRLPSFYAALVGNLLSKTIVRIQKQWLQTVDGSTRASFLHALGIVRGRSTLYGHLFYWPLFIVAQILAIGFNAGLLVATLLKIFTQDLAFGWQSTIQFSSEAIFDFVKFSAIPWSWLAGEGFGYPSLLEIEGSHIILKEGIYHLATEDLIAWWPFLIFCTLFYGLFFRFALFLFGKITERSCLKNIPLNTPNIRSLLLRMQTPLVSTQAEPEDRQPLAETVQSNREEGSIVKAEPEVTAKRLTLVPADIFESFSKEELNKALLSHGLQAGDLYQFMVGYEEDLELLQQLENELAGSQEEILVVMEGWMVPLIDFLSYLKQIRKIVQSTTVINIALLGKPQSSIFTPVTPEDLHIWKQKIEAEADPYLRVFPLIS